MDFPQLAWLALWRVPHVQAYSTCEGMEFSHLFDLARYEERVRLPYLIVPARSTRIVVGNCELLGVWLGWKWFEPSRHLNQAQPSSSKTTHISFLSRERDIILVISRAIKFDQKIGCPKCQNIAVGYSRTKTRYYAAILFARDVSGCIWSSLVQPKSNARDTFKCTSICISLFHKLW